MPQTTPPAGSPQAFEVLVSSCEDGTLLAELNDRVRDLIGALHQQQVARGGTPKGSFSVAFQFSLDHAGILEVSAAVAVKEPKAERSRTIFYRLGDNSLSPNNPRQLTMDLPPRTVEGDRELRVV